MGETDLQEAAGPHKQYLEFLQSHYVRHLPNNKDKNNRTLLFRGKVLESSNHPMNKTKNE